MRSASCCIARLWRDISPTPTLRFFAVACFGQLEHSARGRPVRGQRLFHENVQPLLDRVGEMHPAKRQRRGEDRDVARLQAIHRLLVGVEADELALLGHVDLFAECCFQRTDSCRASRSLNTSAMATSLIGPFLTDRALAAAPVPRPPQPMRTI